MECTWLGQAGLLFDFVVTGRLICGVHWLTDIAGAILLSLSAFHLYVAAVNYGCQGGLNRGIS